MKNTGFINRGPVARPKRKAKQPLHPSQNVSLCERSNRVLDRLIPLLQYLKDEPIVPPAGHKKALSVSQQRFWEYRGQKARQGDRTTVHSRKVSVDHSPRGLEDLIMPSGERTQAPYSESISVAQSLVFTKSKTNVKGGIEDLYKEQARLMQSVQPDPSHHKRSALTTPSSPLRRPPHKAADARIVLAPHRPTAGWHTRKHSISDVAANCIANTLAKKEGNSERSGTKKKRLGPNVTHAYIIPGGDRPTSHAADYEDPAVGKDRRSLSSAGCFELVAKRPSASLIGSPAVPHERKIKRADSMFPSEEGEEIAVVMNKRKERIVVKKAKIVGQSVNGAVGEHLAVHDVENSKAATRYHMYENLCKQKPQGGSKVYRRLPSFSCAKSEVSNVIVSTEKHNGKGPEAARKPPALVVLPKRVLCSVPISKAVSAIHSPAPMERADAVPDHGLIKHKQATKSKLMMVAKGKTIATVEKKVAPLSTENVEKLQRIRDAEGLVAHIRGCKSFLTNIASRF